MNNMNKWKRRGKGAISIFLIIIMLSNYALIGVLVDSARHRMARANAEMALDTAASSVLSYYNQMVFDLYGLFATDSLSNEEIQRLLTDYTSKTLGITEISPEQTTKLTQAIVNAIPFFAEESLDGIPFDGYDYKIDISVDDTLPSLANTKMVEDQIIDHMKYKAPMTLMSEGTEFVGKLQTILQLGDRIKQTIEKISDTKDDKKELSEHSKALLDRIREYNNKLLYFLSVGNEIGDWMKNISYDAMKTQCTGSAYNVWDTVDHLDEKFRDITNSFVWPNEEYDENGDPIPLDEDEIMERLRKQYTEAYNAFLDDWKIVGDIASSLHNEANSIWDEAEALNSDYTAYINQLQQKLDADPDNENTKTLYAPEIELAKSTCGEVLKNMNLVLAGRQYLRSISDAFTANSKHYGGISQTFADGAASAVIDRHMGRSAPEYATSLRKYITSNVEPFGAEANEQITALQNDFNALFKYANEDYEEPKAVELEKAPEPVNASSANDTETEKDKLEDLNQDDLAVTFEQNATQEWACDLDDSMDTDNTLSLLNAAMNILDTIGNALEGARDSLYIDEYIIAYFPNYVQHYNATDKDIAQKASNKELTSEDSYYKPYNATLAEVEYVLSGNPDSSLSVLDVEAKITAVRMAFNTAAIFMDSGKTAQANALATAISGPFAPVVAPLLMVAWALAESVLDTNNIMSGEEVQVFKQGADWTFSLEGGIKTALGKAEEFLGDEVADAVNDKISDAAIFAKNAANKAIYEAYQCAESGVGAASKKARDTLTSWGDSLQSRASGQGEADNAVNKIVEVQADAMKAQVSSSLAEVLADTKDRALVMVNTGVAKVEKEVTGAVSDISKEAADQIAEWAGSSLSEYFDVGNPKNTGAGKEGSGFDIKMDYMDYIRLFLLFYGNEIKVQRVQQLIQANIRHQYRASCTKSGTEVNAEKLFKLEDCHTSVSAKLTGSINFLFMSSPVLPEGLKQNGRLKFTVSTSLSY